MRIKRFATTVLAPLILVIFTALAASAGNIDPWHWRNPLPQGHTLRDATYANGLTVAVGDSGTILVSSDGVTWARKTSGTTSQLNGVAFGAPGGGVPIFVAVGNGGTILTSPNGETWTARSSGTTADLRAAACSSEFSESSAFVAVGTGGVIVSTTDGMNWVLKASGVTGNLNDIVYSPDSFIIVGDKDAGTGKGIILTSPDGGSWYKINNSNTTRNLNGIAYNGSRFDRRFIAVGDNDTVLTSADGFYWLPGSTGTGWGLTGAAFGNGTFVAAGDLGTITVSTDNGFTWQAKASGSDYTFYDVAYGNGTFSAVGYPGTISTSAGGATWGLADTGPFDNLTGIATNGALLVVSGKNGLVLSSTDGVAWSKETTATVEPLNGIAYGNGAFAAVGGWGTVLTSANGSAWSPQDSPTIATLNGIVYGDKFVAVGENGAVITSPNGASWTAGSSGVTSMLNGVAYGNGTYVAVGISGVIRTSTDGTSWTGASSGTTNYLGAVAYGNGKFVAVGDSGTILTSSNGASWTPVAGVSVSLIGISYINNLFLAMGDGGVIYSSPTGASWTQENSITTNKLRGASYLNGAYIAVGDNGTILQTAEGVPPTGSISINGGAANTTTTAITLQLSATDNSGTVSAMQFSNDNITWSLPQAYATSVSWTLTPGEGTKTVYVRFMDVNENWSIIYSDTITYNTPKTLTLNVTGNGTVTAIQPAGLVCAANSSCSSVYMGVTEVTLAATTWADYSFTGWSGACGGTGNCTMTLTEDAVVNATFSYVQPAKIMETTSYYSTLLAAYNAAQNGNTIQTREFTFIENVLLNKGISVTLKGGYDTGYATNSLVTTIQGNLTIGTGSVTIEKVVVK